MVFLVVFSWEFVDLIETEVAAGKLADGAPSMLDTIMKCAWSTVARGEFTGLPPLLPRGATVTPYGGAFVATLIFLRNSWIRERSEGLIWVERLPFFARFVGVPPMASPLEVF